MSITKGKVGLILLFVITSVQSYVYDLQQPLKIHHGEKKAFGYSMDFIKDYSDTSWLFVGAPKDSEGGTLNACNLNDLSNLRCGERLPNLSNANKAENFTDQLLGVSVTSTLQEVWACAPRYQYPYKKWKTDYHVMRGNCFAYSGQDFQSNQRFIPLENEDLFGGRDGHENDNYLYGAVYGEAGMSFHYDPITQTKYWGAPGVWNWAGTFAVQSIVDSVPIMTQPWSDTNPRSNDYTGFDITTGVFLRSRDSIPRRTSQVAVGAPRAGPSRAGLVFIVETDGNQVIRKDKVEGEQTGEYFGSAVIAVDINNDGYDELVVGSPLYTHTSQSQLSEGYEEGRISIYSKKDSNGETFELKLSYFGQGGPNARYGSALANLGDLDQDGFSDFAVGAPFEDNGAGVVRLYFGRQDIFRLQDKPETIIKASQFNMNLKGFGVSFSKGHIDIDNNGLTDLAIGSYVSGSAVILRRLASVWLEMTLESSVETIDIERLTSFNLELCMELKTTNNVGQSTAKFLNAKLHLDIDPRTEFATSQSASADFTKTLDTSQGRTCLDPIKIQLKSGFNPTVSESDLIFNINVEEDSSSNSFQGQKGKLDYRKSKSTQVTVPFKMGCSGTCQIDLSVNVTTAAAITSPFVIGSSNYITLIFTVFNLAQDPAYLPILKVPLSDTKLKLIPPECQVFDSLLVCQLPGPIRKPIARTISMDFDVSNLIGGQESLIWQNIEVYSKSQDTSDTNLSNDKIDFQLDLKTEADIALTTSVEPEVLDIKDNDRFFTREFTQTYQIRNVMTSPIKGLRTQIDVPTHYAQKELVKYTGSYLQLNDGTKLKCQEDNNNQINTIGRATPEMPDKIDCVSTPGTRCIEINCPTFDLIEKTDSATLMINLKMIGQVLDEFQVPDLLQTGVTIATKTSVKVDESLEELIKPFDNLPNEIFSFTKFVDSEPPEQFQTMGAIIAGVVAGVILIISALGLWYCGFFKRKDPKERAKEEGMGETGFENGEESSKMLNGN